MIMLQTKGTTTQFISFLFPGDLLVDRFVCDFAVDRFVWELDFDDVDRHWNPSMCSSSSLLSLSSVITYSSSTVSSERRTAASSTVSSERRTAAIV